MINFRNNTLKLCDIFAVIIFCEAVHWCRTGWKIIIEKVGGDKKLPGEEIEENK